MVKGLVNSTSPFIFVIREKNNEYYEKNENFKED